MTHSRNVAWLTMPPASRRRARWLQWIAGTVMLGSLLGGCSSQKPTTPVPTPRIIPVSVDRLSKVQFSSDGLRLAVGNSHGDVLVTRDPLDPLVKLDGASHAPIVSLAWSPDGLLTVTHLDRHFVGWQFGKSEPAKVEFPGLPTPAVCVAFRPATKSPELVIGMKDGSLVFLNKQGTKQLKPDHRGAVKQLMYSQDGRRLISAGADGQILWRDAESRKIVATAKNHKTEISQLLLSRDGQQLVSSDWNGAIHVWDATSDKVRLRKSMQATDAVSALAWSKGKLVSGDWSGNLQAWDAARGTRLKSIATGQPIHDLAADPKTGRVITVHLDRSLRLWDPFD